MTDEKRTKESLEAEGVAYSQGAEAYAADVREQLRQAQQAVENERVTKEAAQEGLKEALAAALERHLACESAEAERDALKARCKQNDDYFVAEAIEKVNLKEALKQLIEKPYCLFSGRKVCHWCGCPEKKVTRTTRHYADCPLPAAAALSGGIEVKE